MQSQLLAALTARCQKARQSNYCTWNRRLQPLRHFAQTDRLDFTLDAPCATRFNLLRLMGNHALGNWYGGRRVAQGTTFNQCSNQFNPVQLSLNNQLATAALVSAGASEAGSIDFDLSSFIIGEGVVTAFFILMVR